MLSCVVYITRSGDNELHEGIADHNFLYLPLDIFFSGAARNIASV